MIIYNLYFRLNVNTLSHIATKKMAFLFLKSNKDKISWYLHLLKSPTTEPFTHLIFQLLFLFRGGSSSTEPILPLS